MIEELFCKPIIVSIDEIDKFEQKELMKISRTENAWYDWLINYVPKSIKNSVDDFKDKILRLFKTSTPEQTVYERGKKRAN